MEWQPINTAPTGKKVILGWKKTPKNPGSVDVGICDSNFGGWLSWSLSTSFRRKPNTWMDLPQPPEA